MDTLMAMVNNPFKEIFYRKKKINILTAFSIFHKSGIKFFFLNKLLTIVLRATANYMTHNLLIS